MNKEKFGSYIKESRIKKNYTQQELADLLFVDVTTVSKWERGVSYPDITLVPDICKALDISEHELIASSYDGEYRKMKKDASKYNNMKKGVFITLNICYAVALITCFIVNVAVNHTLSWFFIVLSSLGCAYTFCPTITWLLPKHKMLGLIISTFVSMFLLFFTCSVYTSNYWFVIATLGVLLGYFISLFPVLFRNQKKYLGEQRYKNFSKWFLLSYFLGMLIIISLLLIFICIYNPFDLMLGLLIAGGCFVIPISFGILNLFDISKSLNKIFLLSLVGILVLLFIASVGHSLYLKSTEVAKVYNIEESYNNIKIKVKDVDINIYLSKNDENKMIYSENKKVSFQIKIEEGHLMINQDDNRKFYDKLWNFTNFELDLYLSQKLIDSLVIESGTGDIEVRGDFLFNNVDIDNSTGDIEFKSNVAENLDIKASTGDVEIENSDVGGGINAATKTGDIELVNVNCNKLDIKVSTGDVDLKNAIVVTDFNMNGSTGNVEFDGFDASNIYITVGTGDVIGTILSDKIFVVRSDTGRVDVPETFVGGVCKIFTSTGDIRVRYK